MKFKPIDIASIADELRLGFDAGALKPPPLHLVPLENAIEAYERIASGQAKAKQMLTFR
jgi:hypothetical protein